MSRRPKPWYRKQTGEWMVVVRGERFGMICFGSRLDVYLPPETAVVILDTAGRLAIDEELMEQLKTVG